MTRHRAAPRRPVAVAAALVALLVVASSLPIRPGLPMAAQGARPAGAGALIHAAAPGPALASPGSATLARAPAVDPADTVGDSAAQPSTPYEEAMAHANDHIAFTPGDRVTRGFTPRADDGWPVAGGKPVALPPGRASGRDMANSANGSRWATLGGADGTHGPTDVATGDGDVAAPAPAPIDAPSGTEPIPADPASATVPASTETGTVDPAAASGLRRQVFGFLPYWEVSGSASRLNYDVLSTIAYFSVGADRSGNLKKRDADGSSTTGWGGWTSSAMSSVISSAHAHGTRVVLTISVFAWTTTQASVQKAILGSSSARLNLARQAAAAVRDRGADGVNLDFEPLASGYADEFTALVKTFRSELNKVHAGYQLTYDTTGSIGNYPIESTVGTATADAIFIMGYDYRTASASSAGSVDPLSGPSYDLTDTIRAYTARVPASRVILGIPWYGRAWSTTSDALHAKTQTGAKYGYSTAVNYESVVGLVSKYGRRWDPYELSPYVVYRRQSCTSTYGCVTSWRQVYYDDAASMKLRYQVVNDYGLRGTGMWALGYDGGRSELYRALSDSFLVDKVAPQAGVKVLPSTELDEGFIVTWAARDASSIRSFDVQVSTDAGAWAAWLTGTKATSDVWLARDGHGCAFRVRATDSKGNVGPWNVSSVWGTPGLKAGGFARVKLDGLSYRTGPDTSAAKLGTLAAGTLVAITRGPISADGYRWYEVTQPIREWGPVSFVERGVWIAGASSTESYLTAYRAPNGTTVAAILRGLAFGDGTGASTTGTGASAAALMARLFSPNGDGRRDDLRVRWTSSIDLDALAANVYRTDRSLVGSRPLSALAAGAHAWDFDGLLGTGRLADGRYVLQLVGTAGADRSSAPSARPVTPSQVAAFAITVDTTPPAITGASASVQLISPNGDGVRDAVKYGLSSTGATGWTLSIAAAGAAPVRTISGNGTGFSATWNGTSDAGARVPDGRYVATLAAFDAAGNRATRTYPIAVDTTGPAVTTSAAPASFSPDGDGQGDTTRLAWAANEPATGSVRVWNGTTLVRSWSVASVRSWARSWDGRNAAGSVVADGRYTLKVEVHDLGGNRRVVTRTVTVDRTASRLRWSRHFFPQDGDSLLPTSTLTFRLARTATTTLKVYDSSGALVRTAWGPRTQGAGARSWTWNGRRNDSTWAPQGAYRAVLTATTSLGTMTLTKSVLAAGYSITPSAMTVAPGQTLTVRFRTIESLATRPRVAFTQPGLVPAVVTATRLADGTFAASFRVAASNSGTGWVKVTATDTGGRINQTSISLKVAS